MAGAYITSTVDDAQARAALHSLAEPDTAALMPRLGEYLQRSSQGRFKTQTAPDGRKWEDFAPLKESYRRRKKYAKDKILTLRGYLRSSIRFQVTAPDTVEVGTNTKYAAVHQFGGAIEQLPQSRKTRYRSVAGRVLFAKSTHKRGVTERWVERGAYTINIPARPYLGISADDDREIREIILDWVARSQHG